MNGRGTGLLVLALLAGLAPAPILRAQATADPRTGLHRVDGTVIAHNKEKSTIRVRQKNRNNVVVTVSYTAETKFSLLNEPATLDEVKDSRRVICLGTPDAEDGRRLVALVIDVRTPPR